MKLIWFVVIILFSCSLFFSLLVAWVLLGGEPSIEELEDRYIEDDQEWVRANYRPRPVLAVSAEPGQRGKYNGPEGKSMTETMRENKDD